MKPKLILLSAVALAAAVAASSSPAALGSGHWLCGPHGSVQLSPALAEHVPSFYTRGLHAATPPRPQPFYRLSLLSSRTCALMTGYGVAYFIPAAGELRIDGPTGNALWLKPTPRITARLRKAVRKVKPYPAPRKLGQAVVDDQNAARPSTYLRLYTIGSPTRIPPRGVQWLSIQLIGGTTPWTDEKNSLWISQHGDYLKRDGQTVRISASPSSFSPRAISARLRPRAYSSRIRSTIRGGSVGGRPALPARRVLAVRDGRGGSVRARRAGSAAAPRVSSRCSRP